MYVSLFYGTCSLHVRANDTSFHAKTLLFHAIKGRFHARLLEFHAIYTHFHA